MEKTKIKITESFAPLALQYDAFLLDLWGVVHDGTAMYPGAAQCLQMLYEAGKPVVIISNAPRRAAKAQAVLDTLGVPRNYYRAIYTSGEVAFRVMQEGEFAFGRNYLFIGPDRDRDVLKETICQEVQSLENADFLLNVGFGSEQDEVADVSDLLSKAKDFELPMLCLNPDLHVVKITGERYECAGVIAKAYRQMGGKVHYFGKPYLDIYERALLELPGIDKSRILAIGDGPDTDIHGACAAGIDSLLITGGIMKHGEVFDFIEENTPTYESTIWRW